MERNNLWAPWRMKYIGGLGKKSECFICHDVSDTENDRENLVLWRTEKSVAIFNRFPYNNGHLLIAPKKHAAGIDELDEDEMLELMKLMREGQNILKKTIKSHGFNVGINLGKGAGAGLPDHLHIHIVPRWEGDTNFMSVCTDTKVISQSLFELYDLLKETSEKEGLPKV